jgi:hypothetical protein
MIEFKLIEDTIKINRINPDDINEIWYGDELVSCCGNSFKGRRLLIETCALTRTGMKYKTYLV